MKFLRFQTPGGRFSYINVEKVAKVIPLEVQKSLLVMAYDGHDETVEESATSVVARMEAL